MQIQPAKAAEAKQIYFVSEQQVYIFGLKGGTKTPSAGAGHSSTVWHHRVE